tara:strand:+ start:40036 stop:40209 length:174 start_codon:yes stop_codon:yes gene_type:complete
VEHQEKIKLISAWNNGKYMEVSQELSKLHRADLLDFVVSFIKDKGIKEIEILKKLME